MRKTIPVIAITCLGTTNVGFGYPKALVNYDDFKKLVSEVEKQRAERLIDLETFLKMRQEKNAVILDSQSDFRFNRKHLKGAIHLSFTDFTQDNLKKLIPVSLRLKVLG